MEGDMIEIDMEEKERFLFFWGGGVNHWEFNKCIRERGAWALVPVNHDQWRLWAVVSMAPVSEVLSIQRFQLPQDEDASCIPYRVREFIINLRKTSRRLSR